jgi:hypothetical protein
MIDTLVDLLEQLALAAVTDAAMVNVQNDGPGPARMMAMDPTNGMVMASYVEHGGSVFVNRAWRLLVQPIDHVLLRPLCIEAETWTTT